MKTISELQQEIRKMQSELQLINAHLTEFDNELLNYKDTGINESVYKRIFDIAESMPLVKHPIINYGRAVKNNYFAILVLIASNEDSANDNQLLFMQRMIMADKQRNSIDKYMEGIGNINPENVIFKIQDTIKSELSLSLVLDMLIIANLGKLKSRKTYEIIVSISGFLGIKSDELTRISNIAVLVLTQDIKRYQSQGNYMVINDNNQFGYYLNDISGWSEYLAKAKKDESQNGPISKENEHGDDWFYFDNYE